MTKNLLYRVLLCTSLLFVGGDSKKFKVDLYSESFCPYCAEFIQVGLYEWEKLGLLKHVDLTIYMSGNVKTFVDGSWECQHGVKECVLNKILNCGMAMTKTTHSQLTYLSCMEENPPQALFNLTVAGTCCDKAKIDVDAVLDCAYSEMGERLTKAAYNATRSLAVPHQYVPWLVVDDIPMYEGMYNLLSVICISLPENKRPDGCYKNPEPQMYKSLGMEHGNLGKVAYTQRNHWEINAQ